MINTLMIFQAIISVLLIVVVLLQFGKGAEAGLFSSGGADSVWTGSQQGNVMHKITVVLSILFMGNSIFLARMQSENSGKSLLDAEAPIARPFNSDNQAAPANAAKDAGKESNKAAPAKAAEPAKADSKADSKK